MRDPLGPLFMERCQANPIFVVPYFTETDSEINSRIYNCLNRWKNMPNCHLTRVELIEFCGTRENFAAVSWIFNHDMPNLEMLTLASGPLVTMTILDLEEDMEVEVWNVNPSTRRTLKNVVLQRIFVPWGSNIFYGLSTLNLDYRGFIPGATSIPMDAFLEVLSHSPRLEKCYLCLAIPHCHSEELLRDTRLTRTVNLPLLEELFLVDNTLNVAYLLRHLRFPVTTKTILRVDTPPDQLDGLLSILFPPDSPTADHATRIVLQPNSLSSDRTDLEIGQTTIQYFHPQDELPAGPNHTTHTTFTIPLLEAVRRAGPEVRFLKIRLDCGLMHPVVWKDILEHLPNLEELVYMPGEDGDHQWPAFWTLLCQTGENGLICQSLRILRIVDLQGIPPDPVGCLAARWKLGRPLDVFQFRMWNCERPLARHFIPYLRPFVAQLIFEIIEKKRVVSLTD